jgi:hypothetical protein
MHADSRFRIRYEGDRSVIERELRWGIAAFDVMTARALTRAPVAAAWHFWTVESPTHRANLDNCTYTRYGFGVYYNTTLNRTYLTHDLAGQ